MKYVDELKIPKLFFATERLRTILINKKWSGLSFDKIEKISKGPNFIDNFPDAQLPFFYWRLNISDHLGENDFAIWKGLYLVVSEKALECLRDNHVTHAEADEIRIPFDDYFTSSQKYFWMSENARKYFIEMEQKKKAPLE